MWPFSCSISLGCSPPHLVCDCLLWLDLERGQRPHHDRQLFGVKLTKDEAGIGFRIRWGGHTMISLVCICMRGFASGGVGRYGRGGNWGGEGIGEGREREEERDQVSHRPVHEPLDEAILGMDAELRKRPEGPAHPGRFEVVERVKQPAPLVGAPQRHLRALTPPFGTPADPHRVSTVPCRGRFPPMGGGMPPRRSRRCKSM